MHSKELASAGEARERERELVRFDVLFRSNPSSSTNIYMMMKALEIENQDDDGDVDGPDDMDGF